MSPGKRANWSRPITRPRKLRRCGAHSRGGPVPFSTTLDLPSKILSPPTSPMFSPAWTPLSAFPARTAIHLSTAHGECAANSMLFSPVYARSNSLAQHPAVCTDPVYSALSGSAQVKQSRHGSQWRRGAGPAHSRPMAPCPSPYRVSLLSHSFALFCTRAKCIRHLFISLRTLLAKHPGCTQERFSILHAANPRLPNSFRIRTYRRPFSKSFRIRTYEKPGGGGSLLAGHTALSTGAHLAALTCPISTARLEPPAPIP
jgi:hypothetical protein